MKKCFLDASSAILLFKVDLFDQLLETYTICMADSVYEELTSKDYPGTQAFKKSRAKNRLRVCTVSTDDKIGLHSSCLFSLDQGERDTILCYSNNFGNFVITDDGQAARYCKEKSIPFINALLFPRILNVFGKLSEYRCIQKMEALVGIGRYSPAVIDFAKNCSSDDLTYFFHHMKMDKHHRQNAGRLSTFHI